MPSRPNPAPLDRYCIEFYTREKPKEPHEWLYFETEQGAESSGWEARRDDADRLFAGVFLYRRGPRGMMLVRSMRGSP